jgi:adenylate cyclase class IV
VKADQKKHKEFYNLDEKTVIVNSIENLGDFLIVQRESIDKDFIEQKLGIEEPEYIEVPFSDLEQK